MRSATRAAVWIVLLAIGASGADSAKTRRWRSLGPAGGSVSALVIDPQHTGTIYAASQDNGVFKTTDGAASWSAASAGLPSGYAVITLALDTHDPNNLYAAIDSHGIFKTSDGGLTWKPARDGLPQYSPGAYDDVAAITPDPRDSKTLYAGTGHGVYKSTDAGENWVAVNSGLPLALPGCSGNCAHVYITAVAVDPQNPDILYAAGLVDTVAPPSYSQYSTVFKSVDGGANWTSTGATFPTNWPILSILLVDPQNPETLYAGTDSGVFKTSDGGITWNLVKALQGGGYSRTMGLALDPNNPDTLYTVMVDHGPQGSAGRLFKSMDGGSTWLETGSSLAGTNFYNLGDSCSCTDFNSGLAIDPQNPDTVYLGSMGDGVLKSTDGGTNWKAANSGFLAMPIRQVLIVPGNPTRLYAANGTRVFESQDAGGNWTAGAWGVPDHWVSAMVMDPQAANIIYAGSWQVEDNPPGKVYKSEDGGVSWRDANSNPHWSTIWSMAIDPRDPATVYAGTESGVFKTMDGGGTWIGLGPKGATEIGSIAIDPQNPGTVYALGQWQGSAPIFKSTDGGTSWSALSSGLPACCGVRAMAIDPQNAGTLYAGSYAGLYKSVDGGANWSRAGLESEHIGSLAVDPRDPGRLYAGTSGGVFRSLDGGASWIAVPGLPPGPVFLTLDSGNPGTVYAAGNGGVFVMTFDGPFRRAR